MAYSLIPGVLFDDEIRKLLMLEFERAENVDQFCSTNLVVPGVEA
jgi:hypothetical protein